MTTVTTESSITTGTGNLTFAPIGILQSGAILAVGSLVEYYIADANGNKEWGLGTIGIGNTLIRTTIKATLIGTTRTLGGPPLSLSGSATVSLNYPSLYAKSSSFVALGTTTNSSGAAVGNLVDGSGNVLLQLVGNVDSSGAIGDGVANDSAAIAKAITTAGVGGSVTFTDGKTYLVDRQLTLLTGQTVIGYGATIKRAAQVTTTTTTGITSGVTNSFTVAAGTGSSFSVGQSIALFNGVNYTTSNSIISTIAGDVITTTTAPALSAGSPWSGTTTVALSFDVLSTTDDCTVLNLAFNGNRASWTKYHWEITTELHQFGTRVTLRENYFYNAPGEAIQEGGASNYVNKGCLYTGNKIINVNGNGIHLSGCDGTKVTSNYINGCNQDAANGHVGGATTISNGAKNLLISGNYLGAARCGVGQIDSSDNSKATITGNIFDAIALTANMTANSIVTSFAIETISGTQDNSASDISITNNQFYNCTNLQIGCTYTVTPAKTITAITQANPGVVTSAAHGFVVGAVVRFAAISGMVQLNNQYGTISAVTVNTFTLDIDTSLYTAYTSGGTATGTYPMRYVVSGNSFYNCTGVGNTPTSPFAININNLIGASVTNNLIVFIGSDITNYGINLAGLSDATISGNTVKFGLAGIQFNGTTCANVGVLGNTLTNNNYYGIYYSGGINTIISNNDIANDTSANAGNYQGIALAGNGGTVKLNTLNLVQGYCGIRINGVANCVVQANTVRASGSGKTIRAEIGSTGYVIAENQVNYAVTDLALVGIRVANNDVIT